MTCKTISNVCEICQEVYLQRSDLLKKAFWKNRCRSHRKKIHKCIDCGKVGIDRQSIRCKKCWGKSKVLPKPICIDCAQTGLHKSSKRCLSCWNKKQDEGKSRARTKFTLSKAWKTIRMLCFERDNFTCQSCGIRGGVLNAHHIKVWSKFPELRLDLSNLITLCESCHKAIHGLKKRKINESK